MEEGYLKNGVYYRRNDFLSGRPTLVFIHGISGCCAAWKPYEEHFGKDCNLLFFDLRGHGKSFKKKSADFYSLDNIADDIFEMAISFGIKRMVLVGHSFGALLALDFADRYYDMVDGLVLLAPDYRINKTFRGKITRYLLAAMDACSVRPFVERYGIEVDYSKFRYNADWDLRRIYIDVRNTSIHVYRHCLNRSLVFDPEKILSRINVPALIIHGKNDSIFPVADSVEMAKKIAGARLKILDNANHILVLNNSAQIKDEIEDFIKVL
jgi:proline iminopeptidase